MDLKTILNDEKIVQTTDGNNGSDNSGTKHKKPIQLRDIESQSHNTLRLNSKLESKEEMKTLINKEKKDILKKPWNKLDTGMKISRLKIFIDKEVEDKNLSEIEKDELKKLLLNACRGNKLNKNVDVVYNREECFIEKIKILKYEDGSYTLQSSDVKKAKSSNRSRSSIDLFIRKT